jgi:quercetin dioxygenase-like cupin family protein
MKVIKNSEAIHTVKPEGDIMTYFLFDEYEVIQVDQPPHTVQVKHHHEKAIETVYVIEGELVAKWEENGEDRSQKIKAGDLTEAGPQPHYYANESDKMARIMCFKRIPTGKNNREIFKNDKVVD